jgi:hypothetical protein
MRCGELAVVIDEAYAFQTSTSEVDIPIAHAGDVVVILDSSPIIKPWIMVLHPRLGKRHMRSKDLRVMEETSSGEHHSRESDSHQGGLW